MRYNTLSLLLQSVPLLVQTVSVAAVGHTNHLSGSLITRASDLIPRAPGDDACDDVTKCKDKGQQLWDALQVKLKEDEPQDVTEHDDKLGDEDGDKDYKDRVLRDQTPDENSWKTLFQDVLHLDYTKRFAEHNVASKSGVREFSQNEFNTNQGVMLGQWNYYNDHDLDKTMPFSEVIYQCYRKECDDEKELQEFQFAGVMNVAEPAFSKIQDELYKKNGRRTLFNRFEEWTYEKDQEAFLAYLGTPKLGFILRMLTDHAAKFGKRYPTGVYTNIRTRAVYVTIDKYEA